MRNKFLSLLSLTSLFLCTSSAATAQSTQLPQVVNRAFSQGGRVEMHLEAGDYQIRRCKEDKIHVEWTAKSSKSDQVKVDLSGSDKDAKLTIKTPSNGNVHVIIEVPATTNLYVRLTAGDLNLSGVDGDKDLASHAGDMNIDVGDPDSYGSVNASVNFGDLSAEAFHVSKGGIHNNLSLNGTGRYSLRAHVGAGDLRLTGKKKDAA